MPCDIKVRSLGIPFRRSRTLSIDKIIPVPSSFFLNRLFNRVSLAIAIGDSCGDEERGLHWKSKAVERKHPEAVCRSTRP